MGLKDPWVENYNLDRNIVGFQTKGLAVVPPGKFKEMFIKRIESLGLVCPEPRIDLHWNCWVFENKSMLE